MNSIIDDAVRAFPHANIPDCESFYTAEIARSMDIYSGEPPWKYVKRSGLYGRGQRRMNMLGCAKVLCDNLAALTFSGQPDIICGDERQQRYVDRALQRNCFWENMPRFLSRAYALGGGVLKVFLEDGEPVIDYIDAGCFIPCGGSGRQINEGIFRSRICRNGISYVMMEKHSLRDGHVVIDRVLFKGENGEWVPLETLFEGLPEHDEQEELREPAFAYFAPAAANAGQGGTMLGASVFSGCTDTLKAIDIAFDSLTREFILGRKRIIVPSACIRTVVDPDTGNVSRYFDADDEVYQALKCDEEKDLKISDNTAELRVSEHTEAINALLDILCFQTGLSSGTMSFSSGGIKTAAEVKSIESRTELTMQSNRYIAAELIEKTVRNIIRAGIMAGELEDCEADVRVSFTDRQTIDRDTVIDRNIRLVNAGLKSRVSAVMEIMECTEQEALAEIMKIEREELS
ncbi:MAG: phage portal protein [Huintestinicola sp.]